MEKLPGDYISGFVDGEGCFALKFIRAVRRERKNKPIYFYWTIEFAIVLKSDDIDILKRIQYTLGCGRLSSNADGSCRYSVQQLDDLSNKVVPFFRQYPLQAKKRTDYSLWVEALLILVANRQRDKFKKINMSQADSLKLEKIHEAMDIVRGRKKNVWKWLSKGDAAVIN